MRVKTILLFGAGKSATVLIRHLLSVSSAYNFKLIVADVQLDLIERKTQHHPNALAKALDISNVTARNELIQQADVVISMMPPSLHALIAEDCLRFKKHLLTASYVDEVIRAMDKEAQQAGVLFLCEMGLDPGIDHMSALKIIHTLQYNQATITSFKSHCGGLVAPESDNNPWHYKISWNPRNVVNAGKAGAVFRLNGETKQIAYKDLFNASQTVLAEETSYSFYPNRNSLSYIELYGLNQIDTFIRTTLRHPDFMYGWNQIIECKLTDETPAYNTDGMNMQNFYATHFQRVFSTDNAPAWLADSSTSENNLFKTLMDYLGLSDAETLINKGFCSAADVLQFALEKYLALEQNDKDRIVMLHEIEYEREDKHYKIESSLVVNGDDAAHTAMAKTVGLPLAIGALLVLNGTIQLTGVQVPVLPEIYNPVLNELKKLDIAFKEKLVEITV